MKPHHYNYFSFVEPGNLAELRLNSFHSHLMFFIIFIAVFILGMTSFLIFNYLLKNTKENITNRIMIQEFGEIKHIPLLEFVWTFMPTVMLINMALPTFIVLYLSEQIVSPAITIKAIGAQWYWHYEIASNIHMGQEISFDSFYLDEMQLSLGYLRLLEVDNFLVVASHLEHRLLVTALDVLHSFALPSLGIKIDAIPGRLNGTALIINVPGTYFGQCSELCGPNHGFMPIVIQVQSDLDYM